jgi:hypothetical protein
VSNKPHGTALEVLVSEMLGDIGRLHVSLERIKHDIPAMATQLQQFRMSLEAEFRSPKLEAFLVDSINSIYIAARRARKDAEHGVQDAVQKAILDGWISVRGRGEQLFQRATADFVARIDVATSTAADQATASVTPLLTSLGDEIGRLKARRFRERWIMTAIACMACGTGTGVLTFIVMEVAMK